MTDTQTFDLLQAKIQMINDVAKIFSAGIKHSENTEQDDKQYYTNCEGC